MIQRSLLVCLLLSSVICSSSLAQDQANFTQFYLNPYILNSSYAGIDGKTSLSLIYRRQWMDIEGGPAIANFSLHTPINPSASTGFSVTNDRRGIWSSTALQFTFGYNIAVDANSFVRFGISGGGSWNSIDMSKLGEFTDPALGNLLDNHASVIGNAGASFHSKLFHIGLAIPQIFSPSIVSEDGFKVAEVKPFQTILVHASNRFYFNDNKNVFEPYLLYRLNSDLPSQLEAAAILHLNHTIWVGGTYKQEFGISGVAGIKLKNMLAIGGSYSLAASGENQLNSPSFEVNLNYLLGARKKNAPVYSFVDTQKPREKKKPTKPNASDAIAQKRREDEAAKKKQPVVTQPAKKDDAIAKQQQAEAAALKKKQEQEALAAKQQQEAAAAAKRKQEQEELAKHQAEVQRLTQERKDHVVTAPPPKKDSTVSHNPRFKQEMMAATAPDEGHHEHEQEQLKRLDTHAENPTEHHNEEGHPNAERHEFVKRGNHAKELAAADYVIGGVFKNEANAKHFSDGLDKLGFNTHYGHLTERNVWYVYIIQTDDINKARAERDRVRKMKLLRDAWLLTVHH